MEECSIALANFPIRSNYKYIAAGLLLLAAILACALPGTGEEPTYPEVARVSLQDAKTAWDAGLAVFVDVRGASSYENSHVAGALSIPLDEIESRIDELEPGAWIITYCT